MAEIEITPARYRPQASKVPGRIRNKMVGMTPLGPAIMSIKNRGVDQRRRQEMRELGLPVLEHPRSVLPEFQEVCGYYEQLHPERAFYWQRANEYLTAHAQGPAAALDLVKQWGFVKNKQGDLDVPDWWSAKMVLPLEFMDYSQDQYSADTLQAAGIQPERFHTLAKKAADYVWMGYYLAKGRLVSGGVSLVTKAVTDSVIQLKKQVETPKDGPLMVYVIGISEDEVAALSNQNVCVIGFNLGVSPVMDKFLRAGRVQELAVRRNAQNGIAQLIHPATQEPFRPQANKFYVCQLNVATDGLPVPDASGIIMTNEVLHHNSIQDQVKMVREMNRVALPVRGGRAWVAGELLRHAYLVPLLTAHVPYSSPTSWDALVSMAHGIVTIESLAQKREELAAEGISIKIANVPAAVANAPAPVHRFLLPLIQALITGY